MPTENLFDGFSLYMLLYHVPFRRVHSEPDVITQRSFCRVHLHTGSLWMAANTNLSFRSEPARTDSSLYVRSLRLVVEVCASLTARREEALPQAARVLKQTVLGGRAVDEAPTGPQ
jgi:hypothetical protein